MTTYVLNTPILTSYNNYSFSGPIGVNEARALLEEGFVSAVGHEATAAFMTSVLGVEVPTHRVAINMSPGDKALVMRLKGRLPEGKILNETELAAIPYELGVLACTGGKHAGPILKNLVELAFASLNFF